MIAMKRNGTAAILAVMAGVLAAGQGLLGISPAGATSSFSFSRVAGPDRFATAAQVATSAFPSGASTVVLATGTAFPDALAGNFLAGNDQAPVLLTSTDAPIPGPTFQALTDLRPRNVVILGGTDAISAQEQTNLEQDGYHVTRIAGTSRYDTMEQIAEQPGVTVGQDQAGDPTAVLATGDAFPDALSAGPLAFSAKLPVILTDGQSPVLVPQASQVLLDLHIRHVVMVGGSGALNPGINDELAGMGISVDQQGGNDRSGTSAALAQDEVANWGFSRTAFGVARGDDFADALGGGAAAGLLHEPMLVTLNPTAPGTSTSFAAQHDTTEAKGVAFGGPGALADATLARIASSAGAVPQSPASQSSGSSGSGAGSSGAGAAAAPPGEPYPSQGTGYDISWPQCGGAYPSGDRAIGVVGVNDGRAFTINPCLSDEAGWASSTLSLYINLNAPNDAHAMSGPAGNCASSDLACQSYNYGWNAAVSSMADASQYGIQASTWWLDIETGNTWSSSTEDNAKVIAGAIDSLHAKGNSVAIYSTSYQWGVIAGSYTPKVSDWVATGGHPSNLSSWCGPSHGFTAGPTWMVQYGRGNYDGDYAC